MKITKLIRTCDACPSQWQGTLEDGRMIYIRYRWGYLSVRVSPRPTTDVDKAVGGEEIIGKEIGDQYDGTMELEELKQHTQHILEFPL